MAPPSPTQLAWRRRIEAVLRVAAPALDLLLATGDRVSRLAARAFMRCALCRLRLTSGNIELLALARSSNRQMTP